MRSCSRQIDQIRKVAVLRQVDRNARGMMSKLAFNRRVDCLSLPVLSDDPGERSQQMRRGMQEYWHY